MKKISIIKRFIDVKDCFRQNNYLYEEYLAEWDMLKVFPEGNMDGPNRERTCPFLL